VGVSAGRSGGDAGGVVIRHRTLRRPQITAMSSQDQDAASRDRPVGDRHTAAGGEQEDGVGHR
jgi:hypothetical protein